MTSITLLDKRFGHTAVGIPLPPPLSLATFLRTVSIFFPWQSHVISQWMAVFEYILKYGENVKLTIITTLLLSGFQLLTVHYKPCYL